MLGRQQIRFCRASDGVRIAYASCGEGPGPPLVGVATWLTHLERDGEVYHHWLDRLSADRTFVRYDVRGCGLSDRVVGDLSLEAKVADLEAVVDAAELDRFDLLGLSGGSSVAVVYAARHPHRVAHLVLYGGYALGRARRPGLTREEREEESLLLTLIRFGWGRASPAFRRVFAHLFMPDATPDQVAAYDALQLVSVAPDMAARIREASYHVDVSSQAAQVTTPTLVLHLREDGVTPFEEGRRLAGLIAGAELVPLEGRNHILGPMDPAWPVFLDELHRFLATPGPRSLPYQNGLDHLTERERALLDLVTEGMDNEMIAAALSLSVRTVERHLSNIYLKLGVSGKAARTAAAVRAARFSRHR